MAEKLVTPAQLRQYASNIDGIRGQFISLMSDVKTTMMNMKKDYESEAATAFMNEFNKIDANINSYAKNMQDYSVYLTNTAQQFDESDKRIETNTQTVTNTNLFA